MKGQRRSGPGPAPRVAGYLACLAVMAAVVLVLCGLLLGTLP